MAKSNKLFKDLEVKNSVSRNGFDLSNKVYFTAKCGELLPIYHRTLMPGDNFRINLSSFTRTRPVETAAFTKIHEYFDVFFVPYRLLGKQIPHILAQDKENPVTATSSTSVKTIGTRLPYMPFRELRGNLDNEVPKLLGNKKNIFGFYRSILSNKLLNHLGYFYQTTKGAKEFSGISEDGGSGEFPTIYYSTLPNVSLLPLASYQKIYYDYFRNTQWEENVPYNYNFDYISNTAIYHAPSSSYVEFWNNQTMFDMQYANYPKDLFFGLLPDSQYGDTAVVDVDLDVPTFNINEPVKDADGNVIEVGPTGVNTYGKTITSSTNTNIAGELSVNLASLHSHLEGIQAKFDILEFRKARFAQHYREIVGTGKKNMKALISKIYNVDIPDTLTDECMYLGGNSNVISISEVDNTNLSGDNPAIQKGKGVGSANGDLVEFEAKEFGCLMIIYHAMPEIDFALNNSHFDVMKTSVDDFANPIFDNLGLQEFNVLYLDNTSMNNVSQTPFIGWTSRYYDYKTSVDMVLGDFRESLYTWVAPLTPQKLFEYDGTNESRPGIVIDYRFFKVNPKILDSIFDLGADSYIDSDQLRVACNISVNAVRPLSYLGIPNN